MGRKNRDRPHREKSLEVATQVKSAEPAASHAPASVAPTTAPIAAQPSRGSDAAAVGMVASTPNASAGAASVASPLATGLTTPALSQATATGRSGVLGTVTRPIVALLSSVKFGLSLFALTLVWVALGTFDPVLRAADFDMIDWYRYTPFLVVMYLMCLNVTVVTFRRIPLNWPNLGVWVIHGSILILAAGSTWFGYAWTDAVTIIHKGRSQSYAYSHNHWEWSLHTWPVTRPSATEPLRPEIDAGTGYAAGDLSNQVMLPALTQKRPGGGATLSERLLGQLLPVPEVLADVVTALERESAPAELVARVRGLTALPAGGAVGEPLQQALAGLFAPAEIMTHRLVERFTFAAQTVATVQERLRAIPRPRLFAELNDLRQAVTVALAPLPPSPRQAELLSGLSMDPYIAGEVTTAEGLRFVVDRSWPSVDLKPEEVDDPDTAVASASMIWGEVKGSRRLFYADDPTAKLWEVRNLDRMVDRFAERVALAHQAHQAGQIQQAQHYADQAAATLVNEADRCEARRFVWQTSAIKSDDLDAARAGYRFAEQRSPQALARLEKLAVQPPRPVELVLISDARLTRPLVVALDDWRRHKVMELDRAGLPGERLVLERCDDSVPGLSSRSGAAAGGRATAPVLVYRVERSDGRDSRVLLPGFGDRPGQTVDLRAINASGSPSAESLQQAVVPLTEPLMVHLVRLRTAVVQGFEVQPNPEADTPQPSRSWQRLVWSVEPDRVPYLALQQRLPADSALAGDYDMHLLFWNNRQLSLFVSKSLQRRLVNRVVPLPGEIANPLRAIRVTAHYDYRDAAGRPTTWSRTFWLAKSNFPDIQRHEIPEVVTRLDVPTLGPVEVGWGGQRVPLGPDGKLRARLEHFDVELLPGKTDHQTGAKEYASYVTFWNAPAPDCSTLDPDAAQTVKVCMNEPKKADQWWFSQNSYDSENLNWTVLSVAHKPGWSDPPIVPYSMLGMVLGVLWAFTVKPWILARRQARRSERLAADAHPGGLRVVNPLTTTAPPPSVATMATSGT